KLFAERLQEEKEDGTDYSDQIELVEGDMVNFLLDRKFEFITLGANAVGYLDEGQRASLFKSVRKHLTDTGSFLMTVIEFPGIEGPTDPFQTIITVPTATDADIPMLLTLMDYVSPTERLRSSNFLFQPVVNEKVVDSKIFTALSFILPVNLLKKEMEAAD